MTKLKQTILAQTIICIVLFSSIKIFAQQDKNGNKYLADFDFFIKTLTDIHPDPYSAFGGQVEFHRAKQEYQKRIKQVFNNNEFATILNSFISKLHDGHTYINIPSSNNIEIKHLPFKFKVAADGLFVQNASKKYKNHIGQVLVAINGIPIKELLEKSQQLRSSENISGAYFNLINLLKTNTSVEALLGKCDNLSFTFRDKKEQFSVPFETKVDFMPTKSQISNKENNGLLYWQMIGKKNNIAYLVWNGIISREYVEFMQKNNPKHLENSLSWPYGFMNIKRTGDIEKDVQQIPSLYEEFYLVLEEMKRKKSKNLIIDLRENSGGMTPLIEPVLYQLSCDHYLTFDFDAEYINKYSTQYIRKIGFKNIDDLNKAWYTNFKIGGYRFDHFGNYRHYLPIEQRKTAIEKGYNGFGAEYVKKTSKNFISRPKIIVLCSPKTFSAAFHFMFFLKKLGNTTIIGVASRQAGNSFMESTNFELPTTKLSGSISNAMQILHKKDKEKGEILRPDIEMGWEDFKQYGFDEDAEVLKALEFIEK